MCSPKILNINTAPSTSHGPSVTGINVNIPDISIKILSDSKPKDLENAERLEISWRKLQQNPSPFSLISWHSRLSEMVGRDKELNDLNDWAMDDSINAISVKVITGDGGTGKSRLAAHFADTLQKRGWEAGFMKFKETMSYRLGKNGTLIIIDYPEENRQIVGPFLKKLAQTDFNGHLRILLLKRQSFQTWDDFFGNQYARDLLDNNPVILESIDSESAYELFSSGLLRLSEKLDTEPVGLTSEEMEAWLDEAQENNRPLFLLALAAHSAYNPDDNVVRYSSFDVVDALVKRELDRLRRTSTSLWGEGYSNVLELILAFAAFSGDLSLGSLKKLQKNPSFGEMFPDRIHFTNELKITGIVDSGTIPAPTSDIIAAGLTVNVLNEINESSSELVSEIVWHAVTLNVEGAIDRFARICYDAQNTLNINHHLDAWLLESLNVREERCKIFHKILPVNPIPLICLKTAIYAYRTLVEYSEDEVEKLNYLNNLSIHLGAIGDNAGAFKAIEESLELYRCLAVTNPSKYEHELAIGLNNHSKYLYMFGDTAGALKEIEESVELYRRLAVTNPEKYESYLASCLSSLPIVYNAVGETTVALKAIEESVEIRRRLAINYPKKHEPALATSLNNLSNCLNAVGDKDGALKAIEESVEISRRLVVIYPYKYEPELASHLDNLSSCLNAVGDIVGPLNAIAESEVLYRGLAVAYPDKYEPDLAGCLKKLSYLLDAVGDTAGALKVLEEAVELYRGLAVKSHDKYEPVLAKSMNTLSIKLYEFGDTAGALKSIEETIVITRRQAVTNPDKYKSNIAGSLNNQSNMLDAVGDIPGALEAIMESVEIRRHLTVNNPEKNLPALAMSLYNLSGRLDVVGDIAGAINTIEESVELYRDLALTSPDKYESDLAVSLSTYGTILRTHGDKKKALVCFTESVELLRPYAERYPKGPAAKLFNNLKSDIEETSDMT